VKETEKYLIVNVLIDNLENHLFALFVDQNVRLAINLTNAQNALTLPLPLRVVLVNKVSLTLGYLVNHALLIVYNVKIVRIA